jgi:hypothetical protein
MNITLCTLFEGDFYLGAAALLNSLHRAGFAGTFVCGHRGPVPAWANHTAALAPLTVRWVEVTTPVHLTNHKPVFMRACLHEHVPATDVVAYLDPDIVVKARWSIIARWLEGGGVAMCEDINVNLPSGHPYRLAWTDFLRRHHLAPVRLLERYYNAGFIAVPRDQEDLLTIWAGLLNLAGREIGSLADLKRGDPGGLFHTVDQDALNIALQVHPAPILAVGPEGMDFLPGGHLLSHATGSPKPWRGGFLRAALEGRPPRTAHKEFHRFASAPLVVIPPARLRWRRGELAVAAALGRFYHRA